ncbi:MAG: hypothetical protein ACETVZ_04695 [Phycisphaerae bacterium]
MAQILADTAHGLWRHSGVSFVSVANMVTVCSQYVASMQSVFPPK